MRKPQKTFEFILFTKFSKKDSGQGPGVLIRQEVTFTDQHNKGFDSPQFKREFEQVKERMLHDYIGVDAREAKENGVPKSRIIKP